MKPNPDAVVALGRLSIADVVAVARQNAVVQSYERSSGTKEGAAAHARVLASERYVARAAAEGNFPLYGINTGFGVKAGSTALDPAQIPWVSRNLIVSHATGVGPPIAPEVVRAALLIRANSLALGYSGVRPALIELIISLLNQRIVPFVPAYGSVGASGDLAPLSHVALVLSRRPAGSLPPPLRDPAEREEGLVYVECDDPGERGLVSFTQGDGRTRAYKLTPAGEALARCGLTAIEFGPKEALAFNNGATFSTALAALAAADARRLLRNAEVSAALCLEGMMGFRDAFLPHVQAVRGHAGQKAVASRIMALTRESTLLDGDAELDPVVKPPQDPYSLRVTPQVLGAVAECLQFIEQIVDTEINAATDNPLVFDLPPDDPLALARSYRVISGGNFHGAPIGYAMDLLKIVLTDLASLSERRIFRMLDHTLNFGLPCMLVAEHPAHPGQTSGLMITQYLAANLVSQCKVLSHPASVDSIPTSANQEDHVSMSMTAALHARSVAADAQTVVAIEMLVAMVAVSHRLRLLSESNGGSSPRAETRIKHRAGTVFRMGGGSRAAITCLQDVLFGGDQPLPPLDETNVTEDQFLRPYVLRVDDAIMRDLVLDAVAREGGAGVSD